MKAPVSVRTLTIMGLVFGSIAALIGLFAFYARYEYAEWGHNYLLFGYIAACFLVFFSVRSWNLPLFVLAIALCVGIQFYSAKKFDWREQYVMEAQAGQPFFLEEYVDHYPTFEEYTFSFLKIPNWVKFNNECVQPALNKQAIPGQCTTTDLIQHVYNIDIVAAMQDHYAKMKNTAKMIQDGKMNKRSALTNCVANKACVPIPLLPKGVDANHIDPTSKDYIDVRQAFWSIINDKKMSPAVCEQVPLCRALVAMKAVDVKKLPF